MKKKRLILKDSDYFGYTEEVIKLEHCANGGNACRLQMAFMNENLLLARKFIENKEFSRAVEVINEAFDSTFDLKDQQCLRCAKLFRESIANSLKHLVLDLEEMTTGFFRRRRYLADYAKATRMLQVLLEKTQTDNNLENE